MKRSTLKKNPNLLCFFVLSELKMDDFLCCWLNLLLFFLPPPLEGAGAAANAAYFPENLTCLPSVCSVKISSRPAGGSTRTCAAGCLSTPLTLQMVRSAASFKPNHLPCCAPAGCLRQFLVCLSPYASGAPALHLRRR